MLHLSSQPSWERIHIPSWEKENHLQTYFWDGMAASSLEGPMRFVSVMKDTLIIIWEYNGWFLGFLGRFWLNVSPVEVAQQKKDQSRENPEKHQFPIPWSLTFPPQKKVSKYQTQNYATHILPNYHPFGFIVFVFPWGGKPGGFPPCKTSPSFRFDHRGRLLPERMTLFFLSRSDPPAGFPHEVSGHVTLRDSAGRGVGGWDWQGSKWTWSKWTRNYPCVLSILIPPGKYHGYCIFSIISHT